MLSYSRQSILASNAQTVVNTVNTVGVMGKGLAAEFKARYPDMYKRYRALCRQGKLKIGMLWLWKGHTQWVLNFPTKVHWRNPSKLEYLESGLQKFVAEYDSRGIREISFPRLGCGNGGLQWELVKPLMEKYLRDLPIPIYIHDYEKDIGLPEHEEHIDFGCIDTFDHFLEHLRAAASLEQPGSSLVNWKDDQLIIGDLYDPLTREDLHDIYSRLLRGPLTERQMPDTSTSGWSKLFELISRLPSVRSLRVEGEPSGIAIQIVKPGSVRDITKH
jgi:O-acetyl-ADP-ribose deacetylase (regulator of RNase III)